MEKYSEFFTNYLYFNLDLQFYSIYSTHEFQLHFLSTFSLSLECKTFSIEDEWNLIQRMNIEYDNNKIESLCSTLSGLQ